MHDIQRRVLHQLLLRPECRYRDIKPAEVEGNLFMYHLRQLFKEGLVKKNGIGRYQLTTKGMRLADSLSLENLRPRIQPKIVTLQALHNQKGEWLLYRRRRQPFYGLLGFPYGKIHLGESIQEAAERELREKTGLAARLEHRGDVYITVYEGEDLLSQMFCHIFVGQDSKGAIKEKSEIGECFWQKIDQVDEQFMPGFKEILAHSQGQQHFFDELVFRT